MTNNDDDHELNDEVSDVEAMSAGLRPRSGEPSVLEQVWPDTFGYLGQIDETVNDAIVSVGALDWTQREQLNHFLRLRDEVADLVDDLERQARLHQDSSW